MRYIDVFFRIIGWKFKIIFLKLRFGNKVSVRWNDRIANSVRIRINGNGHVSIGQNVEIRENVVLNVSDGGVISIGDNVFINDMCCINAREEILIKEDVMFGQGVKIYDHDHDYRSNAIKTNFIQSPISIKKQTWVCSNVVILKGCTIGENSVIAAGTIVRKNVSPNVVCFARQELVQKEIEKAKVYNTRF